MFRITRVEAYVSSTTVDGHRGFLRCPFLDMPVAQKGDALGCVSVNVKTHLFHHGGNDFHWQDEPLTTSCALELVYNPGGLNPFIPMARLIRTVRKHMFEAFSVSARMYGKDDEGIELWFAAFSYDPATECLEAQTLNPMRFEQAYKAALKGKTAFAKDLMDWTMRYNPVSYKSYNLDTFTPESQQMDEMRAILKPKKGAKHG